MPYLLFAVHPAIIVIGILAAVALVALFGGRNPHGPYGGLG